MLDSTFVTAVLEGIEGTLEELIGRVDHSYLRGRLITLQDETTAVRRSFEASSGGEPAASEGTPWTSA